MALHPPSTSAKCALAEEDWGGVRKIFLAAFKAVGLTFCAHASGFGVRLANLERVQFTAAVPERLSHAT